MVSTRLFVPCTYLFILIVFCLTCNCEVSSFSTPSTLTKATPRTPLLSPLPSLDTQRKKGRGKKETSVVISKPAKQSNQTTSASNKLRESISQLQFNATQFREHTRKLFSFGFDNYMSQAYPHDELQPLNCGGRSADPNEENININDVLANVSVTLIDTLDTLAIMGNYSAFWDGVDRVVANTSFHQDTHVQVFEATIRLLGGLLSAHILATTPSFNMTNPEYDNELLMLARDLATRLLPAFEGTATGLPHPRVNLISGVPVWQSDKVRKKSQETNLAAVGTLLLELGTVGRLTGDPTYEGVARRALRSLWKHRSNVTHLFGNTIDIHTGKWKNQNAGFGAGADSFFEYLFKASVLFGDDELMHLFKDVFSATKARCFIGTLPLYGQVNMHTARLSAPWIDSLQAFLPGLKVSDGDVPGAIVDHEVYLAIWRKYKALPERFNFFSKNPDIATYPLRPEFAESTYLLYRATKSRYYQRIGAEILLDIEKYTKTKCGFATLRYVNTNKHEDRMESFFLSETLKYLYLLFDDDHILHTKERDRFVFTTEAHILPASVQVRYAYDASHMWPTLSSLSGSHFVSINTTKLPTCESISWRLIMLDPLTPQQREFINAMIG
eukprot:m.59804 g.59804  ORF g.59804 m.59804 type:complete len:614 (-) comp7923_c0_seq1:34-1875(-)